METHQPREEFLHALEGKLHYDLKQLAFCTHYSWFGVVKKERLGVEQVHLFYNGQPALLSPNLLTFHIDIPGGGSEWQKTRKNQALYVEEDDGRGFTGRMAFLDSDILCYSVSLSEASIASEIRGTLLIPATEPALERFASYDTGRRQLLIQTRMPRSDPRDPDESHPLTLCVRVPEAFTCTKAIADGMECPDLANGVDVCGVGALVISFIAERGALGGGEHPFVIGIGEGPAADRIVGRMDETYALGAGAALFASTSWLNDALSSFSSKGISKKLHSHHAKAAYQLLSNAKAPRGLISRYAAFPSRGAHCAHFLWDSCFVSQGLAQFNERLATDALLALCENQEDDGKIPQFVCATWRRPGAAQPPLIAWAAWNLYQRFGDRELIERVYEPACRFVEWWFDKRDEDNDGLAEYFDGSESGCEDSPRFDDGPAAAIDLNSYLNREMRLLARMAPLLGRIVDEPMWERRAGEHEKLIYSRLYDHEDGIFYDRLVGSDRFHKVLTPASFMPLWCDIKLPKGRANDIIARYLTNPKHFFGARPFPSVAYSDRRYDPEHGWRGPVWPHIAWVMTEILRYHGFRREYDEAVRRLLEMMTQHQDLSELYSSSTGKPLGVTAMGRSCAVFMMLCRPAAQDS